MLHRARAFNPVERDPAYFNNPR